MAEIKEVLDGIKELVNESGLIIQRVDSIELLDQVLRLRYQVYCNECKFIKPQNCPHEIESDKYDPCAIHFAVSDKYGVIGTMRLVTDSPHGFPFEEHCREKLYTDTSKIFRKESAEISRLVVSKRFRRRAVGKHEYFREHSDGSPRSGLELFVRRFKPIALGMYREMYIETKARGIKHWYALMEKPLNMLLRKYGFEFTPIGKEIDVCGIVTPYLASVENIEMVLRERFPIFMKK